MVFLKFLCAALRQKLKLFDDLSRKNCICKRPSLYLDVKNKPGAQALLSTVQSQLAVYINLLYSRPALLWLCSVHMACVFLHCCIPAVCLQFILQTFLLQSCCRTAVQQCILQWPVTLFHFDTFWKVKSREESNCMQLPKKWKKKNPYNR